ncbi:MAG: carbohydrate kinase [Bacteroidales bacterium]|nr:carbohydrate kinase [Bacteroidales bacterium]
MFLLGYDVGSSSVKASLVEVESGKIAASAFYPKHENTIISLKAGWAEQDPESWWENLKLATADVLEQVRKGVPGQAGNDIVVMAGRDRPSIAAIGISYQMHGLVCVDKNGRLLRHSIIWCDSRAVPYGEAAFEALGKEKCLGHLLNSPGNFTAAKLAWVKENEPAVFDRIDKIMLPGDFIAYRMTGEARSTVSGLSEGMFWDFKENRPASFLMDWFGFGESILPDLVPTFSEQGRLTGAAAAELGLEEGIPVTYRAGDQPNNALSLNVFEPGDIAATAGTSGVVYGVSGKVAYDPLSRVNTFAHVNHTSQDPRLGILLCVNGTGIANAWIRKNVVPRGMMYDEMNAAAQEVPVGCDGVGLLPFGNGAERMLCNKETGCEVYGLNFNVHSWKHLARAVQEGIAFSFKYGIDIMEEMGMRVGVIRAGAANMFQSGIFRDTLASVTGAIIELLDTDGAAGAARGAGIGAGIYKDHSEAFASLKRLALIEPSADRSKYLEVYSNWKNHLNNNI